MTRNTPMLRLLIAGAGVASMAACGPKDQEECRAEAAKKARSEAALEVLLESCWSEFPANRVLGGGYEYRGHPVAGPSPTKAELADIERRTIEAVTPAEDATGKAAGYHLDTGEEATTLATDAAVAASEAAASM